MTKKICFRNLGRGMGQRRSGVAVLVVVAVGLAGLLVVGGCSTTRRTAAGGDDGGARWEIRPYAGDIQRVLTNARYLKLLGRLDLARKELEAGYQQAPDNLPVADELAQLYEELGDFDSAARVYQEALNRRGDHAALHNNLCFSYYQAGKWDKAEACFRQVLARHPDNVTARNNLGLLLCRLGRQEEARGLWRAAEGEAGAQQRLEQALAVLGLPPAAPYAGDAVSGSSQVQVAAAGGKPQRQLDLGPEGSLTGQPRQLAAATDISPSESKTPSSPEGKKPKGAALGAGLEMEDQEEDEPDDQPTGKACGSTTPEGRHPRVTDLAQTEKATPERQQETGNLPTRQDGLSPSSVPGSETGEPVKRPVRPLLTAEELAETAIEVLNGNGMMGLAAQTRSLLHEEGYHVAGIGNHRDWGAEKTTIYYRPGAEKVAQALKSQFFQQAQLQPEEKLSRGMDVRLVLGRDVMQSRELLAKLCD